MRDVKTIKHQKQKVSGRRFSQHLHVSRTDRRNVAVNHRKKEKAAVKAAQIAKESEMLSVHISSHSLNGNSTINIELDGQDCNVMSPMGIALLDCYEDLPIQKDYEFRSWHLPRVRLDWDILSELNLFDIHHHDHCSQLLELLDQVEMPYNSSWKKLFGKNRKCLDVQNLYGNSILHYACYHQKCESVKKLLKLGAHISLKNLEGNQPIHVACVNDDTSVVSLLLHHKESKALISAKNNQGNTPLHISCLNGNNDVTKLLLDFGARINIRNINNKTPFDTACEQDNVQIASLLLSYCRNKLKHPLACSAIEHGATKVLKMLLMKEENVLIFCPEHNNPVLSIALETEEDFGKMGKFNLDMFLCLRNHIHKKRNLQHIFDHLEKHDGIVIKAMFSQIHVNMQNEFGNTFLHYATYFDKPKVAKALLNLSVKVLPNRDGNNALHVSCIYGNAKIAQLLLDSNANPYLQNIEGMCPLAIVCRKENMDILKVLLMENHVNPNVISTKTIQDKDISRLPLVLAGKYFPKAVPILLQHKAKVNYAPDVSILQELISFESEGSYRSRQYLVSNLPQYFFSVPRHHHITNDVIYAMISAGAKLQSTNILTSFERRLCETNDEKMISYLAESGHRFSINLDLPDYLEVIRSQPYHLHCLAAKVIRTNLMPNAWVGIRHVPLPKQLKRIIVMHSSHVNI